MTARPTPTPKCPECGHSISRPLSDGNCHSPEHLRLYTEYRRIYSTLRRRGISARNAPRCPQCGMSIVWPECGEEHKKARLEFDGKTAVITGEAYRVIQSPIDPYTELSAWPIGATFLAVEVRRMEVAHCLEDGVVMLDQDQKRWVSVGGKLMEARNGRG